MKELRRSYAILNGLVVGGLILFLFPTVLTFLAPFLAPWDPLEMDLHHRLAPPSRVHLLGTDVLGRDVFSRLLYGGRMAIVLALFSTAITLCVGTDVGMVAGYFGGGVDGFLSLIINNQYVSGCSRSPPHLGGDWTSPPSLFTLLIALNLSSWWD